MAKNRPPISKEQNKKNTIAAVVILVLIIAIPAAIVFIMQSNKPEWKKQVDSEIKQLQNVSTSSYDAAREYVRNIYALYLAEGDSAAPEGVSWSEYYGYLVSQSYWQCSQIPLTEPSADKPASEFVACKHL